MQNQLLFDTRMETVLQDWKFLLRFSCNPEEINKINLSFLSDWVRLALLCKVSLRPCPSLSTRHQRNLKTEVSVGKRIKCFPSTLRRSNLITEVSLWKRIKCFSFTVYRRNSKTEVSLHKRMKCFPSLLQDRWHSQLLHMRIRYHLIDNLHIRDTIHTVFNQIW